MMSKLFACPLAGGKIDSDFCLEIQECVSGITEPTIETEEFLEVEGCAKICGVCKYHYADQRIIGATAKYGDPSYMTTLGDKVRGAYNHMLCTTKGFFMREPP